MGTIMYQYTSTLQAKYLGCYESPYNQVGYPVEKCSTWNNFGGSQSVCFLASDVLRGRRLNPLTRGLSAAGSHIGRSGGGLLSPVVALAGLDGKLLVLWSSKLDAVKASRGRASVGNVAETVLRA